MIRLEQRLHWLRTKPTSQQMGFLGAALILVALTISLMIWAISPCYGLLFSHLTPQEAQPILRQLDEAHVSYQLQNQGADILVDKRLVDKTRLQIMASPVQFNRSVGFELFDKTDFSMTDFSQKVNYQRALQGELERTIMSIEEVQQARVQLTIPEQRLFSEENNQPRAAVTLHLKHRLNPHQIHSIQKLIAASVAHLSMRGVVMIDQNGHGLLSEEDEGSTRHFSTKRKLESYLTQKVIEMIHPIFTPNPVTVKIDVRLNFDEIQREHTHPNAKGLVTHEKETRHSSTEKSGKSPSKQDLTREKSYQLGEEKERFTHANGTIERLTVSVVLPKNTEPETIERVKGLVQSVVGFDETRGDVIHVEALLAEPAPLLPPPKQMTPVQPPYWLGLLAIGSLLLITTSLIRYAKRKQHRQSLLAELNAWLLQHD
jgi:flagellar M-ring protein FliF